MLKTKTNQLKLYHTRVTDTESKLKNFCFEIIALNALLTNS